MEIINLRIRMFINTISVILCIIYILIFITIENQKHKTFDIKALIFAEYIPKFYALAETVLTIRSEGIHQLEFLKVTVK